MPVRKADLGPLTKISEGGFSVVYRVAQYRMPGDPTTPLAYKEFTRDVAAQAQTAERSVSFRDLLNPADRADLDKRAVWPRALVEDRGSVVGFIMPLVAQLDAAGVALMERVLNPDPKLRPQARELYDYLCGAAPDALKVMMPYIGARVRVRPLAGVGSDAPSADDMLRAGSDAEILADLIALPRLPRRWRSL